ncbi:MAG: polysulfide reductase NrfD [Desulfobacterales bacterium]|jgi:molybdopterin-containing oxidoreductase family membrane subunit|nr:polysulfide reductase NrfD [Desulfobacterales bacterium]
MFQSLDKYRSMIRINKDVPSMPFIILGAILLFLGFIGVVRVFWQGHEAVYGVTRQVPWGLLIATYAYFVITSTGLAFIGGLGHAFGVTVFAKMSRRIVLLAFIILLAGFTQIGMELGHPFRLLYLFILSPNFSAPIVWMGLFYSIELVILAIELYVVFNPSGTNHKVAAVLGFFALLVGIVATSNLGFVFGSLTARPFYHGVYFPMYLVVSGIAGGAALLMLIYNIIYKFNVPDFYSDAMAGLGKLMGICLGVMIFLLSWKIVSSLYTQPQDSVEAVTTLLKGPLSSHFWIGEILLALCLPVALLLISRVKNLKALGMAGLAFMIGMFFTRYDFIVAGQLPPMRAGLEGAGVETIAGLVQYSPSVGEWMVFALGLGLFLFLYFMSERFLVLDEQTRQ